MYAWEVCRALFGDVKLIIAGRAPIDFQTHLLNAAGVPSRDIVRINGLVRCRCLLLATQSFSVEHYASPTSARMWATIRDRSAARDVGLPDRIYLSRVNVGGRKLANESSVERIFERFGFTVIHPETLRVETQIALVSNARLIAGPGGSGMFNLAFRGGPRFSDRVLS
jgi:capsular polysaccharide biosynthesis protein